jgi:hypothetical protein
LSVRVRRRRAASVAVLAVLAVLAVAGAVAGFASQGSAPRHAAHHPRARARQAEAAPAIESGLLPWHLTAPISRQVVLPGSGNRLVVLGGLTGSDTSADGVYALDTATGALAHIGSLATPLHDAAGAVIGGNDVIFGGGAPQTVATVQSFLATVSATPPSALATGTVQGQLPAPRSDAVAVGVGTTTYIVGGFDGSAPDATVLATSDGRTFSAVAPLAEPVRYAAVASSGGEHLRLRR